MRKGEGDSGERREGELRHKCHPLMNLCRKYYPNRKMVNCSKIGRGMDFGKRGGIRGKGRSKRPKMNLCRKFHQIGEWESVYKRRGGIREGWGKLKKK